MGRWCSSTIISTEQRPPGQVEPSQVINFLDHHRNFLAYIKVAFHFAHFFGTKQAVLSGDQLHKSAEIGQAGDFSGDDVPHH
jgi:hypothetical protein